MTSMEGARGKGCWFIGMTSGEGNHGWNNWIDNDF